jgi:hypothetical protein
MVAGGPTRTDNRSPALDDVWFSGWAMVVDGRAQEGRLQPAGACHHFQVVDRSRHDIHFLYSVPQPGFSRLSDNHRFGFANVMKRGNPAFKKAGETPPYRF